MKIRKLLFNRTTMMLVTILGEGLLIYALLHWLGGVAGWIAGVLRLIGILIVLNIVRTSRHLAADLMWIFLILLFPVFGTGFYLFLGANILTSKSIWRFWGAERDSKKYYHEADDEELIRRACEDFPAASGQIHYLTGHAGFPVYENNENGFDYYPLGDDGFPVILEELMKAQKFIFLEYFIIARGQMWDRMHEMLKQKAAEGLDVRVLYDDMGSFSTLPMSYAKTLQAEGIRCIPFNRISPVLGAIMNHRDHRKILVIDGKTAFSGGINLADEYINAIVRFGHWKDNVIRVRGAAVWSYTVMFLTNWQALSNEEEDFTQFKVLPEEPVSSAAAENPVSSAVSENPVSSALAESKKASGENPEARDGYIIPYSDMPLDEDHVGQDVYMNILNEAKDYCYIMTPYLILDNEFVNALGLAAARGVDVRIITPGIPDKKTVFGVTRSFYESLIQQGVRIYEYTPGFVHAKVFVSDDRAATVGTINLDYRSLYLHFENGTCLIGSKKVLDVKRDVTLTLEKSAEVPADKAKLGFFFNVKYGLIRIFAGQL